MNARAAVAAFAGLATSRRLLDTLRPGSTRAAGGLWGASAALVLAVLHERRAGPLLVVTADDGDAEQLAGDLRTFTGREPTRLPRLAYDVDGEADPRLVDARIAVWRALAGDDRFLLLASQEALLQPAPTLASLTRGRVALRTGSEFPAERLVAQAERAGLRRVPVLLAPGELSVRGDVVDLQPLGGQPALRIEWLGGTIESIRTFDPASQLSLQTLDAVELHLGAPVSEQGFVDPVVHVLRRELCLVRHEPLRIATAEDSLARGSLSAAWLRWQETTVAAARLDAGSLPSHDIDFKILSAGSAVGSGEADPVGRLRAIRGLRGQVHIVCRSESEQQRLQEVFAHKQLDLARERVSLGVGSLSRGFRVPELELTMLSNVEFAGVPAAPRVAERPVVPARALRSFFELGPGDLVVHAVHGIARFAGIERIERGEAAEDHLRLEFKDDVALLVPASKIHLIQKYVGAGGGTPPLDRLGGKGFQRRKEEVQQALFDLAADLLDVQAAREQLTREPYPADPLEEQFRDAFPFTDTPDQAQSWAEIQRDLERPRPMDRLLCGDVGFGKTEIALRAAFRVAITGRQVAVLCPTTVLADQHGQTFAERCTPLGLRVAVLSRFTKARKALLADVARGHVDILIGTHALLSDDVAWHQLGLLVVDEEQRFGVRHKEQVKRMRRDVDVLTLSATPIPRTLHSSLLGLRDISMLTTPPPGRQDVETLLTWFEPELIRHAVERELARGGQVFVLHNRIDGLAPLQRQIQALVPAARIVLGHGQMTATQMEQAIRRFVRGDCDVLVCTTIVENGLDLPRANTILIDRPELFGLAELHQLRGRVGRSGLKAWCLLLLDRLRPPGEEAKKRLKTLEEFGSLGAGFALAMKDLELRGAGNLLGPEQSGHIAAVGYEMYVQLLRTAVESARAEHPVAPPPLEVDVDLRLQAYLPDAFAPDARARLDLLRELDGAVDAAAAARIESSLRDRHGKLPRPVTNLLQLFLLKHLLGDLGVRGVQLVGDDRIVVLHPRGEPLGGAWLDAFREIRPVEAGKTHLMLGRPPRGSAGWTGEQVLRKLLAALQGQDVER